MTDLQTAALVGFCCCWLCLGFGHMAGQVAVASRICAAECQTDRAEWNGERCECFVVVPRD